MDWNSVGQLLENLGELDGAIAGEFGETWWELESLWTGTGESVDWNSVGQLLENLGELDGATAGESGETRWGNCWRIWGNLGES